jgi:hypothetical protein
MAVFSLIALLTIVSVSVWHIRSSRAEMLTDRQQKLVATAIRLAPWLSRLRSRYQHLTWEIEQGLNLELALRNPWQFQEDFTLPELQDVAALQDLWVLTPAPFSKIATLLLAVSNYNALVGRPSLYLQGGSPDSTSEYAAFVTTRLRAIGELAASATSAVEQITGVAFEKAGLAAAATA